MNVSYQPNSFILYILFKNPDKLKILSKYICNIDISDETAQTVSDIVLNKLKHNKWSFQNSPVLLPILNGNIPELDESLIINNASCKYRVSKTLNNYPNDVAKSGLQKYIRRCVPDKAIYMLNEIVLSKWFAPEDCKAIMTNLFNRIRITYFEDIGIGCASLLSLINDILPNDNIQNWTTLPYELSYLINCMCYTTKTRICSHIRSHYILKRNMPEAIDIDYNLGLVEEDDTILYCNNFIYNMKKKHIDVMHWLQMILNKEKVKSKYYKSTRPGFLVFYLIYKYKLYNEKSKKYVDICMGMYKNMKMNEQFLPVYHSALLYILEDFVIWQPGKEYSEEYIKSFGNTFEDNLLNNKIILDNYVLDKHTKTGKYIGRNSADFAVEGSLVSYDLCLYPGMQDEYYNKHFKNGTPSSEKAEFTLKVRTQINTGNSKQDVYFAKTKSEQNVVVKGPYLNIDEALNTFKIQNALKLFKGVNTYNVNIMTLKPDMYGIEETGLGTRKFIEADKAYTFVVMEDIMNADEYPIKYKSSKVWNETKVFDYDEFFEDNDHINYGVPTKISEKAVFSLIIQIAIRQAFEIGDMASRNFIVKDDRAWNVDTESIGVSITISKLGTKEDKNIIKEVLEKNKDKFVSILEEWLEDGDYYISKWLLIEKSLSGDFTEKIKNNIREMIEKESLLM